MPICVQICVGSSTIIFPNHFNSNVCQIIFIYNNFANNLICFILLILSAALFFLFKIALYLLISFIFLWNFALLSLERCSNSFLIWKIAKTSSKSWSDIDYRVSLINKIFALKYMAQALKHENIFFAFYFFFLLYLSLNICLYISYIINLERNFYLFFLNIITNLLLYIKK